MRTLCISTITVAMLVGSAVGVTGQDEPLSGPMPSLEMRSIEGRHSATLLLDGTVLVVGAAANEEGRPGAAEIYDPATRSFSSVESLQVPRHSHTATRLPDGRVVILGGTSGGFGAGKPIAEVEIYDPDLQQFSVAGRLKRPRQDHSAVLLDDGRVLALGGMDWSGDEPGPISAIEAYDPVTQRSTRIGRLRQPRWDHDAFQLPDGRVLIVGMVVRDPHSFDFRVLVELFDPQTGESERLGRQGTDLMRREAVRLADDRVLLVGGRRPAVIFDPATLRFEEIDRPTTSLSGESLTLLDDGRVLVLGGEDLGPALGPAVVELFDPATETFEQVGKLHSVRRGHEATKLVDGTVLLTGGYGNEAALRSAEVFDPAMLDVVAYGPVPADEAAAPTPTPKPVLAPLGSFRSGGVIKLPGSGFRIRFPDRWSVEVLDPDLDYRLAGPGDTWTALRAYAPDGDEACTVAVGVVPEGANDLELEADTDQTATEAYWRGRRRLMMPWPQVEPLGYGLGGVTGGYDRRAKSDPGIDHDVYYAVSCLSASERMPDDVFKRFKVLPAEGAAGSAQPDKTDRVVPATPGPLPSLGAAVSGGRIEMAGSGFTITLPKKWVVKLVGPDPDIYTAAPGAIWEALRAHEPGRRRACSVYVGIAPLDAGPIGESAAVDTDEDATEPYWSIGGRPTLVVPPAHFRQRSDSGSEMAGGWSRPRADDTRLPHDVVYAVACGADGDERDLQEIVHTFEVVKSKR
jgi:hypothetical protein